ncbi:putative SAM-dependent methyltransferase [Desulfamplus magnetovallimortis]|uniref:Putative SAM-dependent methyltransferase n=1 Tax=Desulfamplus magnetovallimortis TaxID=1246637 RepID=A0A1W1H4E5_9BACT|nr:class I SAM-dependent methyltransferase [Desulfamplus magnetovallimortis]SLM27353.1 putative SAM-dependent methyltransferase [Desulfamplus magnetovallimortis]
MITVDFNRLGIKPGYRILDIGCGEGRHTAKAWEFPGTVCIGADMSHGDLLISSEKLKHHEEFMENIRCRNTPRRDTLHKVPQNKTEATFQTSKRSSTWALSAADITCLPFSDNSFDVVICSEVMEHIHGEYDALMELKRVLKKGGMMALSIPRYWPEKICWNLSREYSNSPGGHIRIYRKKELEKKVINAGFIPSGKHHYAHSLHSAYWWLKCLVGLSNTDSIAVNAYHSILVWDLMKKPFITRFTEKLLNPLMGKSIVFYFSK